jgi:hypothetical protein
LPPSEEKEEEEEVRKSSSPPFAEMGLARGKAAGARWTLAARKAASVSRMKFVHQQKAAGTTVAASDIKGNEPAVAEVAGQQDGFQDALKAALQVFTHVTFQLWCFITFNTGPQSCR